MTNKFLPLLSSKFKKTPYANWEEIPSFFGDVFYCTDGKKFERTSNLKTKKTLPLLFTDKPVVGDLIPASSWGSSLANILTKKSWDCLRYDVINKNNNVCQLCGTKKESLSIHEVWKYIYPSKKELKQKDKYMIFGTQVLDDFVCVCNECHECFHLGLANSRGRFDIVMSRLKALNNWDNEQGDLYVKTIFERFDRASEIGWLLDLKNIKHPEGKLTIAGGWNFISKQSFPFIRSIKEINNVTALLNVEFCFTGDSQVHGPISESFFDAGDNA